MQRLQCGVCCRVALLYALCGTAVVKSMTVSPDVYFTTPETSPADAYNHARYASGPTGYSGEYDGGGGGPYRYGQRSLPTGAKHKRLDRGGEQKFAMYETPHTYQYMMDPTKKEKNQKSRVPKTEKRPPGEDVELIDGSRGKERSDEEGERSAGRRNTKGRPQKNGGSSDSGGGGGGETEERSDETAETKHRGRVNVGDLARGARYVHDELPVKHKIHKKNEFSKKQQFYDEEHIDQREPADGGVRKPYTAAGHKAKRHGQHGGHGESNVKRIVRRKKRKNPPNKNSVPTATTSGYKRPTGGRVGQYGLQPFQLLTK